ncbi:MAG TPA: DUF4397 domain-containing protein [Gammaproteobacteria bacterium]|nr:DUF4397 domain-containing protein [Gammaproteobacteria bacterium]
MSRSFHRISLIVLGLTLLSGCDQGRQSLPDTSVRVVNAAPSYASVSFRREQSAPSELAYKNATDFTYDQDQYDFHIEVTTPGATSPLQTRSFPQEVVAEMNYTFVVTEVGGLIEPVILEYPALANNAAEAQIVALHAGAALVPMDVYLERPGINVVTAIPRASLSFGQILTPRMVPSGDYELTLTAAGNPANVLFASPTFSLSAAVSTVFVIVDEANQGVAPLSVLLLGNAPALLLDKNLPSALRVINGATDTGARDVAINSQFTPPLFAAVPFATASNYELVPTGDNTVNVTPAGNPGVLELTQTLANPGGAKQTMLVTGDPGTLTHLLFPDDDRRIVNLAKLRILNGARQFTLIDFFIIPTDSDINTFSPITSLAAPGGSSTFTIPPTTYDLVLRQSGTTTVLAGPQPIVLTAGGIFTVLATNGADATTASIVLLDDF